MLSRKVNTMLHCQDTDSLRSWESELLTAFKHDSVLSQVEIKDVLRHIKTDINKAKQSAIDRQRAASRKLWQEKTKVGLTYMPWSKTTHMLGREVR